MNSNWAGLLDRKICRISALQYFIDIKSGTTDIATWLGPKLIKPPASAMVLNSPITGKTILQCEFRDGCPSRFDHRIFHGDNCLSAILDSRSEVCINLCRRLNRELLQGDTQFRSCGIHFLSLMDVAGSF